jgi:hypothetical protein
MSAFFPVGVVLRTKPGVYTDLIGLTLLAMVIASQKFFRREEVPALEARPQSSPQG